MLAPKFKLMIVDVIAPLDMRNFSGVEFIWQSDLLQFALMTVIIEVPLFYLCGYRRFKDCLYFAGVNVVTNLLLNEFLELTELSNWQIILP